EDKGYVRRERSGGVYLFRAARARDEVIGRQLEELVERMCGGALQPLLTNLVRVKGVTPGEVRELLAPVGRLDPKSRKKRRRGRGTLREVGLSRGVRGAVLARVAAGLAQVCRRPALAHSLWVLVLLKLLTPPLVHVPLPWPPAPEAAAARAADLARPPEPVQAP